MFSFQEEARLYLQLGGPRGGWAIVEATPDEVIWVLLGPLRGIMWVVLDPMAGGCAREAIGLVAMSREGFLDLLSGQASLRRPLVNVGVGTGSGIASERRQRG